MKQCTSCKKTLDTKNFYKNKITPDGFSSHCQECSRACKRLDQKRKKKAFADFLGGKCKKCGYSKNYAALHFHHVDESTKEIELRLCWSFKKIKEEIKKCTLLCANCHTEEHNKDYDKQEIYGGNIRYKSYENMLVSGSI